MIVPTVLFAGGPWSHGAAVTPPGPASDLLSALVAFLAADATIATALGDGEVYSFAAPAGTDPPFLVVASYSEEQPGEDAEDQKVSVSVLVRAAGLDQCRTIAAVVKNALDTPTINPRAAGRDPFAWATGAEHTVFRDASEPERQPGVARNGRYSYREQIDYEFFVTPVQ